MCPKARKKQYRDRHRDLHVLHVGKSVNLSPPVAPKRAAGPAQGSATGGRSAALAGGLVVCAPREAVALGTAFTPLGWAAFSVKPHSPAFLGRRCEVDAGGSRVIRKNRRGAR